VLLSPDVTILERAVRERPDVAAAVLDQMRYGQLRSGVQSGVTPGRNGSGADDQADETDAGPGPEPGAARDDGPDRVGGDRR
jgi:hypothetical protein